MVQDRVIIAGTRPVGQSIAAHMAEAGLPAIVLEAEPNLPTNLRASTFHPPTLDMLERFGATEKLIAQGLIAPTFQYRDRDTGKLGKFDFGELSDVCRHPYRLQCEQYKLNFALLDYLKGRDGVEVRFGAEVASAAQSEDGVAVTLTSGETIQGADGARSAGRWRFRLRASPGRRRFWWSVPPFRSRTTSTGYARLTILPTRWNGSSCCVRRIFGGACFRPAGKSRKARFSILPKFNAV